MTEQEMVFGVLVKEAMLRKVALSPRLRAIGKHYKELRSVKGVEGEGRRIGEAVGRKNARAFVKKHQNSIEEHARRHPEKYVRKSSGGKVSARPGVRLRHAAGAVGAVGVGLLAKKLYSMRKGGKPGSTIRKVLNKIRGRKDGDA